MSNFSQNDRQDEVFSKAIKAGKRTYFFDVKATRGQDFYVTITESKRNGDSESYQKHKLFLYKEDFDKFLEGLQETLKVAKEKLANTDSQFENQTSDLKFEDL
jgi:hypothetical protein